MAALLAPLFVEAASYRGKRVKIHFADGRQLTGEVIDEEEGKRITLRVARGQATYDLDEKITQVEVLKPPAEEFAERSKRCKSAKEWLELARWCASSEPKLDAERLRALNEAVKLEPDNADVRKELGHVKVDGRWVDEAEIMAKKGLVRSPDGKWVTQEELDRINAEKSGLRKGSAKRELERIGVPWGAAPLLKSKNYILKCNSTRTVAERYLKVLESLHRAYAEVLKGYEFLYATPSTVYIFRTRDEFMEFTLQSRGVGGYFSLLDRSVRAFHGSFGVTGNTDMVLAHEACHQFQHRIMPEMTAVPNWLIEGMAVYFGDGTKIRPERVKLHEIPRDRLSSLRDAINSSRYVDLEKLLLVTQTRGGFASYDHGWGLIFWCLQGDNKKYKNGHTGEGKAVWDQYLRHVCLEVRKPLPAPARHFEQEAKYFKDLLLRETGKKSIAEWEEGYKKFILELPIEPLGKWTNHTWRGTGLELTAPEGFTGVSDLSLWHSYREATAATTADGLRLVVRIEDSGGVEPAELLRLTMQGTFTDIEYDEAYRESEQSSEEISVSGVFKVLVTSFRGKWAKRRESAVRGASNDEDGDKGETPRKKTEKRAEKNSAKKVAATAELPSAARPNTAVEVRVRAALFTAEEKAFLIVLVGPDGPFSKMGPKFDELLGSVKIDVSLTPR